MNKKILHLDLLNKKNIHLDQISGLQFFLVENKQFMISSSFDRTIKLWNASICPIINSPESK